LWWGLRLAVSCFRFYTKVARASLNFATLTSNNVPDPRKNLRPLNCFF
ncbi:hypothetical protein BAE44_0007859, partial [Dichanthelium oligosanthes]